MRIALYIIVMAGVTYLLRALPFTLCRSKVQSPFLQYFFAYIPYAVLAAMTVPHIFYACKNPFCGLVALVVAVVLAFFRCSLITVAMAACVATFVTGMLF